MAKVAKTERLYVRIDADTKNRAAALCDTMGITVTDAVTLFLQQSLKSGRFPFNVDPSSVNSRSSQVK